MPTSILIPIDFSAYSQAALEYGQVLARQFGARLYLFHAVCFPRNMIYGTADTVRGSDQNRVLRRVREKMERLMEGRQVDWQPRVDFGHPVEAANRAADALNADLIITASHGVGVLRRILSGTVVEQFARTVHQPLLVIHPRKPLKTAVEPLSNKEASVEFTGFRRIIVGCDFQNGSAESVRFACRFARKSGAECHLVHFLESPMDETLMNTTRGGYGEQQEVLREDRRGRLKSLLPESDCKEIPVKTAVLPGVPWEGMVAYVRDSVSDLVVVGLRFHNPWEKLWMGSTTESVLRHIACPVMVLPDEAGIR
ncbi:MAG: universal stress protein [Thermodesulfobacteriota bacterium]